MGRVWVARELGSGRIPRLFALKTALAEDAVSEEFWTLMVDEARIASQIRHPNVCASHALDMDQGVGYLVMNWLDGGSLRELLDAAPEHRLDLPAAVRIIALVAAGLHAAHELIDADGAPLHIVHRDVSPQNILLSASGQVKMPRLWHREGARAASCPNRDRPAQRQGVVYGARAGDEQRRRCAFRYFCARLRALRSYRRPTCFPWRRHASDAVFDSRNPLVLPSARRPGYPRLERIVVRALDRTPSERFQTAGDFARALEAWLASERAVVTQHSISEIVQGALGKSIAARAERIRVAISELDAGGTVPSGVPVPIAKTPTGTSSVTAQSALPSQTGWSYGPWPALGGLVLAVGAFGLVAARELQPAVGRAAITVASANLSASTPSASAPSVSVSASAEVAVTVRAEPAHAALFLDDGPALSNPYTAVVIPEARPHRLRVSAAGYAERIEDITFDRSREILITLQETPKTAAAPPSHRYVPPAPPPTSQPPPAALPPVPATASRLDLPQIPKPPRRVMNTDNPFAPRPGGSMNSTFRSVNMLSRSRGVVRLRQVAIVAGGLLFVAPSGAAPTAGPAPSPAPAGIASAEIGRPRGRAER